MAQKTEEVQCACIGTCFCRTHSLIHDSKGDRVELREIEGHKSKGEEDEPHIRGVHRRRDPQEKKTDSGDELSDEVGETEAKEVLDVRGKGREERSEHRHRHHSERAHHNATLVVFLWSRIRSVK